MCGYDYPFHMFTIEPALRYTVAGRARRSRVGLYTLFFSVCQAPTATNILDRAAPRR
ncbi:hypothetical protein EV192_104155 [Actinocrispum wychmicini]|uniref:Uncharacterized protein n=1 Tax=Actinocrispum wychmicini TaxID=1213861 RepID=A0A4R2JJK5_9PSEU|nr:hypothetical protein EV192_104155 [Actinocrispum wychmicini]